MSSLKIRFVIRFDINEIKFSPNGPLTHRWLPDGQNDSITLNAGNTDYNLKIWFRQRGTIRNNEIVFSLNEFEVDPTLIPRQGVLDAGPMSGELSVKNIIDDEYNAVINNRADDQHYISFAKRIIDVLLPPVNNFIRILKLKHGQYWIEEIPKFDSRFQSLGSYCNSLGMKWSLVDAEDWNNFHPTGLIMIATVVVPTDLDYFHNYITRNDWDDIIQEKDDELKTSIARESMIKCWKLFDQGDNKHSIIEGITALESAIIEPLREGLTTLNLTYDKIEEFKKMKLPSKLTVICAMKKNITSTDLQHSLDIYEIRNKIVHDGEEPPEKIYQKLKSLLNTISKLTLDKNFKFPNANHGNAIRNEDDWERLETEARSNDI